MMEPMQTIADDVSVPLLSALTHDILAAGSGCYIPTLEDTEAQRD